MARFWAKISLGQCSDYTGYHLLQDEELPNPKIFIAHKGKGGMAIIPRRSKSKKQTFVDPFFYALRNQIERCANKDKNARRLVIRYDKTAKNYLGAIHIVSARLWINLSLST